MTNHQTAAHLSQFPHHCQITTRWSDNDAYGHINNVVFYGFMDTAINRWLISVGALDIAGSDAIGLVVETGCRYRKPLAYPQDVVVGLRLARLGNTSVRYDVAIFGAGEDAAAAEGHFTHVYVARDTGRPVPVPFDLRKSLDELR
ncbi:acyl-CoA thioesterase [Falsiroseomonas sp.]|uniref:acyl-CoA thioesterase n=1 Tax=Falsiroseomonas sp. TaxID=2870721 RepID=UPI003F730B1C